MQFSLVLAAALVAGTSAPAGQPPTRAGDLPALRGIERGLWELKARGSSTASRRVCVADPNAFIQIQHGAGACSRFVIDSQANRATVHYTCPGSGHGRTIIRVENPRVIQIESQGIANNAPFNVTYEGRHTGACR